MSRRALILGALVVIAAVLGWVSWRRAAEHTRSAHGAASAAHDDHDGAGEGVRARASDSAARSVGGQVLDASDTPVDEGTVSLRCLGDDDTVAPLGPALALDVDGRFEGPGCAGVICATLHHPALVPAAAWVLEPGKPAELRARRLGRLVGTVLDRRGGAVAAAQLTFVAADAGDEGLVPTVGSSTVTDADGTFAMTLVDKPPCDPCTEASSGCDEGPLPWVGRLAILVVADGFAPGRVELEVDPAGTDPIEIRLAPPADTLSGTLTDPEGEPYPRAQVLARSRLRPDEQHHSVPVGENFVFESLGDGPYDLRALQDGVELATAEGAVAGEDVELHGDRIASGPDVIVLVREDGQPRADVAVDGGPFRGAKTDMQGQVRAERAMPGEYTLLVRPSGGRGSRHPITIERGTPTAPPAIARIEIELPTRPQPRASPEN